MEIKLVSIGYGHYVNVSKVTAIVSLLERSAPLARIRQEKDQKGKLVSLQNGKRARSMLITDPGTVILSALTSETLVKRIQEERK